MILALGVSAVVALGLISDLVAPRAAALWSRYRARRRTAPQVCFDDPGRELRAEQRARELLRSCVSEEEWAMYRELGFVRVWSVQGSRHRGQTAYLIYPHEPIVAYVPATRRLLNEYCVTFPDATRPYGSSRLPDSDDVLAKWMALTGDERRLLDEANMHLPGHQVDTRRVIRDLWRLSMWERARAQAGPTRRAATGTA